MRKVLLSVIWSLSAAALAHGALIQHEFATTSASLAGSDHHRACTWGLSLNSNDEAIKVVAWPIANLNDYAVEPDGVLCIHLRDSISLGAETYSDTTGGWSAGESVLLTGSDPGTGPNPTTNWSYLFTPHGLNTLRSHAAGGFDSGLGPDSRVHDAGVDLTITRHALEPTPLLIGGLAVTPLLYGKRR